MIQISEKAKLIKPSPTLSISKKAKEMEKQGFNVINFGVGEPDFYTPDYIKQSAKAAIDENFTRYTAVGGISELKEAICKKFDRENSLSYKPENILVSPGAKASIILTLMAICNERDEVIVASPYWVSYPSQISIAGAKPSIMITKVENDFKFSALELQQHIDKCTNPKVLLLNTPNNPTGTVYSKEELEEIAQVCIKNDLVVISDEIYEKLIYDDKKHFSIAQISKQVKDITVIINGVSKAYAMTGWRLGYIAGPKEIVAAATRLQAHMSSCVNSIAQKAAVSALNEDDGTVEQMRKTFANRKNFLYERVSKIDKIKCIKPEGAFYAMVGVDYYLKNNNKGITNSIDFCQYILEEYHVAIVPGFAFGMEGYVRFSYANSMNNIKEGLDKFEQGLKNLL